MSALFGEQDAALYNAHKKSLVTAYILLFLFGFGGIHRFYAGRNKTGFAVLLLFCLVIVSGPILPLSITFGITVAIWNFVDIFLIPGWISKHNAHVAKTLI